MSIPKKAIKHELIPQHERISSEEKDKLLKTMNVNFKDLPKIFSNDPALAEMELKAGDIVKVKRKSSTAKETFFYRGVIDA